MDSRKYWRVLMLAGLVLAGWPTRGGQARAAAAAPDCALVGRDTEAPDRENLFAATAVTAGDVWAAGSINRATGAWHWLGTAWTPVAFPVVSGTIRSLAALGPADVWAVGDVAVPAAAPQVGNRPLALHWTGQGWQQVPVPGAPFVGLPDFPGAPTPAYLTAVAAAGPADVWAVGQGLFQWDGGAWAEHTADLGPLVPLGARLALTGVTVPRPGEVWAAGSYRSAAQTESTPILLHENGAGWQRVEGLLPTGVRADLLAGLPGQEGVWAAGQGTAHWDGVRWTAVPLPAAVNRDLNALTVQPDGSAWALSAALPGTGGSQILRWDGQRWGPVASPISADPTADLLSLAVEGPNDVWAVGTSTYPTEPGLSSTSALTVHIFNPCALPTATQPDPSTPGARYFAPTGHTLRGVFRTYWEQHGGLAQFGYPLTEEFAEKNVLDGQVYTVQYFERNRFESHPEHAGTAYEVLLGLLGRTVTERFAGLLPAFPPVPPPATGPYFPETGHTLAPEFAGYWAQHGGLAVYGFPISEPYQETSRTDGKLYLTQYFERNRLEYHPEHAGTSSEVLLGLLGVEVLKARGWLP